MIDFIISIVSALNAVSFRNSLQIEFCGVRQNASYIYADSSEILLGIVMNSTMIHSTLSLNEACNFTDNRLNDREEVESNLSELEFSTVTALPVDENKITEEAIHENYKCNEQNYYLLFASVLTFVIGLAVKPGRLYEMMKLRLNQPDYAGNDFTRIRTRL